MSTLIKATNICKKYGKKIVLDNINLEINEGEILGIVGPNGGGKTTLIEIISNIIIQSSGEIEYKENFDVKKNTGIQFQEGYWPKGVNSKGIIKYFLGYSRKRFKSEEVKKLIDIFEISEFLDKDLNNLSGGQKQRLNAVLSVINNPKLIILDELITGLDSKMQKKLGDFFKERMKEDNTRTTISISHIPEEVELFCDRVILIANGQIFYDDYIENIKSDFGSVRNFLNKFYNGKLVLKTKNNIENQENIYSEKNFWKKVRNRMKINFIKNHSVRDDLLTFFKNFILLFMSTFNNFRTYIYMIVMPISLSLGLYFISTYTQPAMFPPSRVAGFMLIPTFTIIILMNTLVSEWKASVFLKRIKVAGTSKTQFLLSIWTVGLTLGLISFTLNLCVYMYYGSFETYGYDWIYQALDAMGTNGYVGLYFSAIFIITISMGTASLIAGTFSSVSLSQSFGILIASLFIATSDVVLPTTTIAYKKWMVYWMYMIPTRYASWLSIITTNSANLDWAKNSIYIFNTDVKFASDTYTYSFTSIIMPIIGSILWIVFFFLVSRLSFKWTHKS